MRITTVQAVAMTTAEFAAAAKRMGKTAFVMASKARLASVQGRFTPAFTLPEKEQGWEKAAASVWSFHRGI